MKNCKYCSTFNGIFDPCRSRIKSDVHPPYVCTRNKGHNGPHVACGSNDQYHEITKWGNHQESSKGTKTHAANGKKA